MTNQRKVYTDEFKHDAVDLVTNQDYKVTEAARSIGINDQLLYRWRKAFQEQASGNMLAKDEREQRKLLPKEIQQLRMEKGILKKASAYFAKEMK